MSTELLYRLNGTKKGIFWSWLKDFKGQPRIAWYPSAGKDFRDLFYLHPRFAEFEPASQAEPLPPDIFLYTDYYPWSSSMFLDNPIIYQDRRTTVSITSIEDLPRCELPLDGRIVDFEWGGPYTGCVKFIEIEIDSTVFGKINYPVLYVFAENAAFCDSMILPNQGQISHIIHVRYGGGACGGGTSTGIWLLNILHKVQCEVLVSDGHFFRQSGDERVYRLFPSLQGHEDRTHFDPIRTIASKRWSGHGDVTWNLVKKVIADDGQNRNPKNCLTDLCV